MMDSARVQSFYNEAVRIRGCLERIATALERMAESAENPPRVVNLDAAGTAPGMYGGYDK